MWSIVLFILVTVGCTLAAPAFWLLALRGSIRVGSSCFSCGYDWGRSTVASCPECGAAYMPAGSLRPLTRTSRFASSLIAIISTVVVATGIKVGISLISTTATSSPSRSTLVASLQDFASGKGAEDAIGPDVLQAFKPLTEPFPKFPDQRNVCVPPKPPIINWQDNYAELSAVASVLESSATTDDRFDAALQAIAHGYRTVDVKWISEVEVTIGDLIAGDRARGQTSPPRPPGLISAKPRGLTQAQRDLLVDTLLDVQGDAARAWMPEWGRGIEGAIKNKLLSPQQVERYLKQAVTPATEISRPTQVYSGDVQRVLFRINWRASDEGVPCHVRIAPVGDLWTDRLVGDAITGSAFRYGDDEVDAVLLLPGVVGDVTLEYDMIVETGEAAAQAIESDPFWVPDPKLAAQARAMPNLNFTVRGTRVLHLLPSTSAPITLDASGAIPPDYGAGKPYWPIYWPTDKGPIIQVLLPRKDNGLGFACDVFVRQDGVEQRIGWTFMPRVGRCSVPAVGLVAGYKPDRPAELVFRASRGLLDRPIWTPRIWDGEVVRPLQLDPRWARTPRQPTEEQSE